MTEKVLGKIDFAEFGTYPDRPFLMGLMLGFSFHNGGVSDGGKYTVNISEGCKIPSSEVKDNVDTITVICNERGLLKAIDAPIIIPASEKVQ